MIRVRRVKTPAMKIPLIRLSVPREDYDHDLERTAGGVVVDMTSTEALALALSILKRMGPTLKDEHEIISGAL